VKKLRGTDRKDRTNEAEPEFDASSVLPPDELEGDALACWRDTAPMLLRAGVLRESDRRALEMLCREWAVYREAQRKVDSSGMLVKAPSGYPMQNPYITIANKAFRNAQSMMSEFGLTPSSRTRVSSDRGGGGLPPAKSGAPNPFAELSRRPKK
jgi:P27 family predicted phage terminase small subunit